MTTPRTILAAAMHARCERIGEPPHGPEVHHFLADQYLADDTLRTTLERGLGMSGAECPAATHHRVRSYRTGGMVGFSDDGDIEYAPNTLESDRCTACGYDFALTPEAPDAAE